jgi:hypothetical protein
MTDLEGLRAKLLMQLDGVLEAKPGASTRLMELCRAYEPLARATRRGCRQVRSMRGTSREQQDPQLFLGRIPVVDGGAGRRSCPHAAAARTAIGQAPRALTHLGLLCERPPRPCTWCVRHSPRRHRATRLDEQHPAGGMAIYPHAEQR